MLCAVREGSSERLVASLTEKDEGPFLCPSCGNSVTIKKGCQVIHHFAHKAECNCQYGKGESEAHRRAKTEIFDLFRASSRATKFELERSLGSVRPDISGYLDGVPIAIEVQISTLSPELILHRTVEYAKKGIYLLWISPWHERLESERLAPKLWERWLHGLYFGHAYYWDSGLAHDYKFEPQWIEKEPAERGGGYSYRSKRYKKPTWQGKLDLLKDFSPCKRREFKNFPASLLFTARKARPGGLFIGVTKTSSEISATDWIAQQAISAYSGQSPTAHHP